MDDEDASLFLEEVPSIPIYDLNYFRTDHGPAAVRISLDGTLQSSLDWKQNSLLASSFVEKGAKLLWDLDLGLFQNHLELESKQHFQTLGLAIKYFLEHLWKPFLHNTLGVNILRGKPPEKMTELAYLDMLSTHVPDALPIFYTLDLEGITSLASQAYLLDRERFPHARLIVKDALVPFEGHAWEEKGYFPHEGRTVQLGVCLPSQELSSNRDHLEKSLLWLQQTEIPYKLISENRITESWDGLDDLLVLPNAMSFEGQRKLKGFEAAGGRILTPETLDPSCYPNLQTFAKKPSNTP